MKTTQDHALDIIHDLIQSCEDGHLGFHAAAQDVKSMVLRSLFMDWSVQRAQFVEELRRRARALGEEIEESGSMAGAMHRGWMNLHASVSANDHAVLSACERGEDIAVEAYRDALSSTDLDLETRELVTSQFSSVKATHDCVRDLRDSPSFRDR